MLAEVPVRWEIPTYLRQRFEIYYWGHLNGIIAAVAVIAKTLCVSIPDGPGLAVLLALGFAGVDKIRIEEHY